MVLTGLEPGHDQILLCLAGGLGEESVDLYTALHGLVPVDAVVVAASTAGVVVAAGRVVALRVTVPVVWTADTSTSSTTSQPAVGDLVLPEDHVALVGPVRPVDPPVVRVTACSSLRGHLGILPETENL